MEVEFTYSNDGVVIKFDEPRTGFLQNLLKRPEKTNISKLSKADQHFALALADLKFCADDIESPLTITDDTIHFSHKVAASISSQSAAKFGLPPITHLTLETDVTSIPGDANFRLKYNWSLNGQKQNPKRIGAILQTSEGLRRIPLWLLNAIELADTEPAHNALEHHWNEMAKFRKALDPDFELEKSSNSFVEMSQFLSNLKVKISDGFSIIPDEDETSGNFQVVPFSNEHIEDQLSGSEDTVSVSMSELSDDELQNFQERFKNKGSLSAYKIGDGGYLVVEPSSKPALDVMANMQSASVEERREFIKNPRFKITEAIEDYLSKNGVLDGLSDAQKEEAIERASFPVFIETAEYSERVTGKTVYLGNPVSGGDGSVTTWLPEIFDEPQRDFLKELPIDDLQEIKLQLQTAVNLGQEVITFRGNEIPASEASIEAITALLASKEDVHPDPNEPLEAPVDDAPDGPIILEVENNFEQLKWRAEISPRSVTIPMAAPKNIITELRPHQEDSLDWQINAWEAGLPGILNADEQGLGKTLQTLSFLAWVRAQLSKDKDAKAKGPILIVAPTTLLENWEQEVENHMSSGGLGQLVRLYGAATSARKRIGAAGLDTKSGEDLLDLDFLVDATKQGQGHTFWVLTTYTTLTNYQHSLGRIPFSVAVFDEIQAMKNPGSLRAVAGTAMQADFRIGLTGTPIENSTSDLWAILDQISPGRLIPLSKFRQEFSTPDQEKMQMLYELIFEDVDGLPPMAIRRLKDDVATELPQKQRILHAEAMSERQATSYEEARRKLVTGKKGAALKMLHHIRSVSVHPDISSDLISDEFIGLSARLKSTFEILDNIYSKNERALVFIEHIQMQYRFIELLKARYDLENVDLINGKTPIKQRQKIVNRFQGHLKNDRGFDVLVLGPKAAGTGLTLTAATHVIHLSRWWNPAVEEQCNDRVHRIGQTKPVTVHVPLSVHPEYEEKSFDLLLHSLMTRKRKLASSALWPMGDTEADMKKLQELLGSEATSNGDENFVKNSILKMFERDEVVPAEIVDDKTYIYD
ncbi:DEAD/DEAH box helicase [Paracoccaceae bacterium]|nr:DEAD/DEAH box helicase [Paracoccaceae bacterium]MDB2663181.1 DEAD/DEAH box helicase [Paracoccaceae bacterium]